MGRKEIRPKGSSKAKGVLVSGFVTSQPGPHKPIETESALLQSAVHSALISGGVSSSLGCILCGGKRWFSKAA